MIALTRGPAARARAQRLHGVASTSEREWLARQLSSLALPIDERTGAERAPAAVAACALVAMVLFGAVGPVVVAVAVLAALAALRRTAPRRRAAATDRALPGVLDAVARNLRAGGSLAQAIGAARPPASAPDLRASWARLVDLLPLVGVSAALDDWSAAACPTHGSARSVRLAAAALSLASTTGGSPARAVDGVAASLRSRLAVAEEIRALSSQARASAAVISLAPIAFGVVASITDDRTRDFFASPAGVVLLAAGLGLDALGAWWMVRLCRPATP